MSLERWVAQEEDLLNYQGGKLGVQLEGGDDVWRLQGLLEGLSLVSVDFARFADGRGYSQASILRQHMGWTQELRAVGDVLRDQLFVMSRVGFDAFILREDQNLEASKLALETFSVRYQWAADEPSPLFRRQPLPGQPS